VTAAGGQALHINAYRQVVQRADGSAVAVAQVELQVWPVREKGLAVRTCGDGGQTGQAALPRQRLRQQAAGQRALLSAGAKGRIYDDFHGGIPPLFLSFSGAL
jgi:hypothetical protein